MIRKIKVTDYPRLIEIWESAVLSTDDFLKEEIGRASCRERV